MMKHVFNLALLSYFLLANTAVRAEEDWVRVAENTVGDRFLVNRNSIQRQGDSARYWEYRAFQQPNNAFLDFEVDQPVYGVMLYQSIDCTSQVTRIRRLVVFDKDKQAIHREDYGDQGTLYQPQPGSSVAAVAQFVCNKA
jgi:hypothetical protein